jgi:2'-5' RNA ligase
VIAKTAHMIAHTNGRFAEAQNLFTLVSYTPEPFRSWLVNLRQELGVHASSEPHITMLPPRPLTMSVDDAQAQITPILSHWRSFEIELFAVHAFPGTNVLYMDVSDGSETLRRMHAELNVGDFEHAEMFEFHPHVTIGGPIEESELETVSARARAAFENSMCPCRFEIREIAFVSIQTPCAGAEWRRLWSQTLAKPKRSTAAARVGSTSRTF